MAIPPNLLQQFQTQPGLPPEQQALDSAAGQAHQLPEQGVDYEDTLINGWGYRQYADGKIKIIVAPEGHRAGATLTGGPAYDAIVAEITASKPPPPPPPVGGVKVDPMKDAIAGLRAPKSSTGGLVGPGGVEMGPPVFPAR